MKTFLIITNDNKDPIHELTDVIKEYIEKKGARAFVAAKSMDAAGGIIFPENEEIDFVLVLGGDGTMLRAARDIGDRDLPMIGINLGTLGFLSDVEKERFADAIDRLMDGDYFVQDRMLVQGVIDKKDGTQIILRPALNDITITRQGSLHVIHLEVYVNGQYLCKLGADGVIASTPTGSTGYNLSAGGPIVHPTANMIVMTPICAHTMNARSIVVGPDETIEFKISSSRDGDEILAEACSDGSRPYVIKTGDRVTVTRAPYCVKLIKLNQKSFLQTLNRKMGNLEI